MVDYTQRRLSERRTLVAPALVMVEDEAPISCVTINVSSGGVKLTFPKDVSLPPDFCVTIQAARVRNRRSRMVWRNGDELGVRFV